MGSTTPLPIWPSRLRDHPHIHGEHTGSSLLDVSCSGSPPYTWGAPASFLSASSLTRITPIYMGSTVKSLFSLLGIKDHPHIHGEHQAGTTLIQSNKGSPPYTWGAPATVVNAAKGLGITPIYMGSTVS